MYDTQTGVELNPGSGGAVISEPGMSAAQTISTSLPSEVTSPDTSSLIYPNASSLGAQDRMEEAFQRGIPAADVPPPQYQQQAPPQQYQQQAPQQEQHLDPNVLAWQNQALVSELQRYEQVMSRYADLDEMLRRNPDKFEQIVGILNGNPPTAQAPQAPQQQGAPPQQHPQAGVPQQPQQRRGGTSPQYLQEIRRLEGALQSMGQGLLRMQYEKQLEQMERQYGPNFNRSAVLGYAIQRQIPDLAHAYNTMVGEYVVNQHFRNAGGPPQQQAPAPPQQQRPQSAAVPLQQQHYGPPPGARVEPPSARQAFAPEAAPQFQRPDNLGQAAEVALQMLRRMKGA